MKRNRVLLADDHEAFLAAATAVLEPAFAVIETACDGRSAMEAAQRLNPDVLVFDIAMPVLNGIEAVRALRAAGCRSTVVFVTVHEDPDFVREALAAGGQGFVVKRRVASDLAVAILEALAGRQFVSPLSGEVDD